MSELKAIPTPDEVNRLLAEALFGLGGTNVPNDWKWWHIDGDGVSRAYVPDFFHSPDLCVHEIAPAMKQLGYKVRAWWLETDVMVECRQHGLSGRVGDATHTTFSGAFCHAALAAVEGEVKP